VEIRGKANKGKAPLNFGRKRKYGIIEVDSRWLNAVFI
jgi:hypothetical protein